MSKMIDEVFAFSLQQNHIAYDVVVHEQHRQGETYFVLDVQQSSSLFCYSIEMRFDAATGNFKASMEQNLPEGFRQLEEQISDRIFGQHL